MPDERWLSWAMELQALSQAGLAYSKDKYDLERFARIREIAAEIIAHQADLPIEKVRGLFLNESGFQTPKIDTRAAVFREGKILLVHETIDGKWSLPGGWCDVDQSIGGNVVKETREEAGLEVAPARLIAAQDWRRHNVGSCPYGVIKVFVLCEDRGGQFANNIETSERGFFALDELPPLSLERNTPSQIRMCFEAQADPRWQAQFD